MKVLKDRNTLITIGATVVLAILIYFLGIQTVNSKVSSNDTKKANLIAQQQSLTAQLNSEKALANNGNFIISKLKQFQQAVPQNIDLAAVLNQLYALSQAANVNVTSVSVGGITTGTLIDTVQLTFSVNGSFNSIENTFIPSLYYAPAQPPQQVPRLIVLTSFPISLGQFSGNTYVASGTVSMTFQALIYIAPSVTPVANG